MGAVLAAYHVLADAIVEGKELLLNRLDARAPVGRATSELRGRLGCRLSHWLVLLKRRNRCLVHLSTRHGLKRVSLPESSDTPYSPELPAGALGRPRCGRLAAGERPRAATRSHGLRSVAEPDAVPDAKPDAESDGARTSGTTRALATSPVWSAEAARGGAGSG